MEAVDYRRSVRNAQTFEDILKVFSHLFGGMDYGEAFRDADRLKRAYDIFNSSTDIEERYEAMMDVQSLDYRALGRACPLAGIEEIEAITMRVPLSELGHELLDRHMASGTAFLTEKGIASEQTDADYAEKCRRIEELWERHNSETVRIFQQFDEECKRINDECGLTELLAQERALMEEYDRKRAEHVREMPSGDIAADSDEMNSWIQTQHALYDEWREESKAITKKRRELSDQYITPRARIRDEELARYEEAFCKELEPLKAAKDEYERNIGKNLIDALLSVSSVSKEEADAWAENQPIEKSAITRLKKNGSYDEAGLRKDLADFYRLTGGRLGAVHIQTRGHKRANAAHWTGVINISGNFTKTTFFHELAHLLEREPKILATATAFRNSRADQTKGVRSLSSITGNRAYRSEEIAYMDDFIDPYVGKVYPGNRSTEVMSMGLQMFSAPELIASFRQKDPGMFNMMVGFMTSKPSSRELRDKEQFSEVRGQFENKKKVADEFYNAVKKKAKGDFWKGSRLIFNVASANAHRRTPKTYVTYYYPNQVQEDGTSAHLITFKSHQDALNFAYLYLLFHQTGRMTVQTAASVSWDLISAVKYKKIPDTLKDVKNPESILVDLDIQWEAAA